MNQSNRRKIPTQDEQCEELIALALDLFSPARAVLSGKDDALGILERIMRERAPVRQTPYSPDVQALKKL